MDDEGILIWRAADNVVVDLQRSDQSQWQHVAHKVRKNVNKARRAGCAVVRDTDFRRVDEFLQVYLSTMRRRHAQGRFLGFDGTFFRKLRDELGSYAMPFLVVDPDDAVVSVELVLESNERLYSFLGGTIASAFPMAPNDLLKYEIITYGAAKGLAQYVLGGGLRADDGIFRYKASFDRDGIYPFYTARIIGDLAAFERASGHSLGRPLQHYLAADYFPSYRQYGGVEASTGSPPLLGPSEVTS